MSPEAELDILIPVYQEGENIGLVLESLRRHVKTPFRVLICYDFVADNTLPAIQKYLTGLREAEATPANIAVEYVKNRGRGPHAAILSGFEASRAPAVLVFPADDDYNAAIIDSMYASFKTGNDVVAASRFIPGGCMEGCPWLKSILVRFAGFTLHSFAKLPIHDPTNGFRLFSAKLIRTIPIESNRGFTYSIELLVKAHRLGLPIAEVPAEWHQRKSGESRFKVIRWLGAYLRWYWYAFETRLFKKEVASSKQNVGERCFDRRFIVLCLLLLLCYQFSSTLPRREYQSFVELGWDELSGCSRGAGAGSPELDPQAKAVGTWVLSAQNTGRCLSQPFFPSANLLEFEYAGFPNERNSTIELLGSEQDSPMRVSLPVPSSERIAYQWRHYYLKLPPDLLSKPIRLRLTDQTATGWIAVRSRMSFYNEHPSDRVLFQNVQLQTALLVFLSIVLVLWAVARYQKEITTPALFFSYLIIIVCIYYRSENYFFWDDWKLLERIFKEGAHTLFRSHNEHFIPLFFSFFALEALIFRDTYLLYLIVSFIIHALNGVLTTRLLLRLRPKDASFLAAQLLGLVYVLYGAQAEVLNWACAQSVLLSHTFTLVALFAGLDYLKKPQKRYLFSVFLASLVSPLFYGGGFATVIILPLVVFLRYETNREDLSKNGMTPVFLAAAFAILITAALYVTHRTGEGSALTNERISYIGAHLLHVPPYVFIGSQYGTLGRMLGIFLSRWDKKAAFCVSFVILFLTLVGVGVVARQVKSKKWLLTYLLIGEGIVIASLLLSALGRAQPGSLASLGFRYQYNAALGGCIVLLPLLELVMTGKKKYRVAMYPILIACFFGNLRFSLHFADFSKNGQLNRGFIAELSEWDRLIQEKSKGGYYFDGTNTSFYGLYPRVPEGLAPDFQESQVCATLNILNPQRYQLGCAEK